MTTDSDWTPRPLAAWWEPAGDGRSRCRIHGGLFDDRCDSCAFDIPPKAPADIETPDYWRECVSEIYGPPQLHGTERIHGFVRHVLGRGPRLRCDYHGSRHVTFAMDEMCIGCARDELVEDDASGSA